MDKKPNILLITFSIFLSWLIVSCDYCPTGTNPGEKEEGDIYFTVIPVSQTTPSIYRIKADGMDMKQVCKQARIHSSPSINKKLVFIKMGDDGSNQLIRSDIDGSNQEIVAGSDFTNDKLYPIISPNGKYIVINDIKWGLWLVKEDGSIKNLSGNFSSNSLPSFSPDGNKIAFYNTRYFSSQVIITVMDLTTTEPTVIANKVHPDGLRDYRGDATIGWSSDGTQICYIVSDSDVSDMLFIGDYRSTIDTGYEITSIGAYQPAFSPDNKYIAFAARDGNIWIRSMADTGKKYINVTNSSKLAFNLYPQWSRDGKSLLYVKSFKDDQDGLHASLEKLDMTTETPEIRVLTNNVITGYWNYK